MKYTLSFFAGILFCLSTYAQAPEKMSYQAVVRDATNNLVVNTIIGMQSSILQGGANGTEVYVETQLPMTNENGLVSVEVGAGVAITGVFADIDWENGPYFIKTEFDLNGGTTYTIEGTSQLLSVPYALHAKTVEEKQELELSGNELSISDGNTITLPNSVGGNENKVWVILTGDISDAEADQKLANEIGESTRFLYVQNTSNLTTLDLSGISENELIELRISDNANLEQIIIPETKIVFSAFVISNNPELLNIEFQSLEAINTIGTIDNNPNLNQMSFEALTNAGGLFIAKNSGLSQMSFPVLESTGSLSILDNINLESVNFELLNNVSNLSFDSNNLISNLEFPSLTQAENITIQNSNISLDINLNNLELVNSFSFLNNELANLNADQINDIESLVFESNIIQDLNVKFSAANIIYLNGNDIEGSLLIENANELDEITITENSFDFFIMSSNAVLQDFNFESNITSDIDLSGNIEVSESFSIKDNAFGQGNFGGVSMTGTLDVMNNQYNSIAFPNLQYVSESIDITNNNGFGIISLDAIENIGEKLSISENEVESVSMQLLEKVGDEVDFLVSIDQGIFCTNNQNMTSFNLQSLNEVWQTFLCFDNVELVDLNVNNLTIIQNVEDDPSFLGVINNGLVSLDFPSLEYTDIIVIENNNDLNSIEINALNSCALVNISENSNVNTIIANALSSVTSINLSDNVNLSNIEFGALSEVVYADIFPYSTIGIYTFNYSDCSLPSNEVNEILNIFRSLLDANQLPIFSASGVSLLIDGQNPSAPPTGQGILDKNHLLANYVNVVTD